jgi:hypothetical protein
MRSLLCVSMARVSCSPSGKAQLRIPSARTTWPGASALASRQLHSSCTGRPAGHPCCSRGMPQPQ